jgi:hypothetical protein
MKQLLQNLGLIVFVIAVGILIFDLFQEGTNNTLLIVSGGLLILGLFLHVLLNKKFE